MDKKATIFDYIEESNKEFKENGRSEEFVKLEEKIINSKKAKFIYLFARYVRGVDIAKIQQTLLNLKALKEGYFLARYVMGAEVLPFLKIEVELDNDFWINNLFILAEKQDLFEEASAIIGDRTITSKETTKLEPTISKAQTLKNKVEIRYLEQQNFDCINLTDHMIFASKTGNADLGRLENDILMHGNPLTCLVASKDIKGINKSKMLVFAMLCRYDYSKIINDKSVLASLYRQLAERQMLAENEGLSTRQQLANKEAIRSLEDRISYFENNPNHVEYVNSICRKIKELIIEEKKYIH